MKNLAKILIVFGFTFAVAVTTVLGQVPTITFDENGRGDLNGALLPFNVGPDPSGGIAAPVLIYTLPFLVTPGDVGLLETNLTTAPPSDLIRFITPAGANHSLAIFYSDNNETPLHTDLADTGLPIVSGAILIPELGAEGANGAFFIPGPGGPGSLPTGGPLYYNIISDVPEPSTFVLAGLASAALLIFRRRR